MTMFSLDDRFTWIRCSGADAVDFLHKLLSSDVTALDEQHMQIGALLNPQGRVEALLALLKEGQDVIAGVHPSLADDLIARLKMYVFRAAVDIQPLPQWHTAGDLTPGRPDDSYDLSHLPLRREQGHYVVQWPGHRQLYCGPAIATDEPTSSVWLQADLEHGIPTVDAAHKGQYVAHMLNLDWLQALALDKGCYPGQEIVARMHFLGRASRRLRCLSAAQPLSADVRLATAEAPDRSVGQVFDALWDGQRSVGLAVVQVKAPDRLVTPEGIMVATHEVPYQDAAALPAER